MKSISFNAIKEKHFHLVPAGIWPAVDVSFSVSKQFHSDLGIIVTMVKAPWDDVLGYPYHLRQMHSHYPNTHILAYMIQGTEERSAYLPLNMAITRWCNTCPYWDDMFNFYVITLPKYALIKRGKLRGRQKRKIHSLWLLLTIRQTMAALSALLP